MESESGNSPVFTTPVERARNAPANPAHPALSEKATTFVRATFIPANEAAISSSRTARNDLPNRLLSRLAKRTRVIRAPRIWIQANHSWGSMFPGGVGGFVVRP